MLESKQKLNVCWVYFRLVWRRLMPSPVVFLGRRYFQVKWVDALAISTKMIQVELFVDMTEEMLVKSFVNSTPLSSNLYMGT